MTENTETDRLYMQRCLTLATAGMGYVRPNPLVGCVIVHDGTIIGEGYHQKYGEAHAEVNAINSLADKSLLPQSTLYVNLEPCAHYGKTPPCADLITSHRLKKVVIGTTDPYSEVAGKGIEKLKAAGIEVVAGIEEESCRYLNRRFFCFHEKKRPYIILKWAQTANGLMGRLPEDNQLDKRISNELVDVQVHKWRTEEAGILVGTQTALLDNPRLTARLWKGPNPVRIILDEHLQTPADSFIYNDEAPTIIYNGMKQSVEKTNSFERLDFNGNVLRQILENLHTKGILSIIVEGGSYTLQQFITAGLWDEARIITTEKVWDRGISAPQWQGKIVNTETIDGNKILFINRENLY